MNIEMTLPDISTTGSAVRIIQWLVEPGQKVNRGQLLLEVETDKSVMEVEAYLDGILLEILVDADSEVEVGQAIAVITTEVVPSAAQGLAGTGSESNLPASSTSTILQASEPTPKENPQARISMFARNRQKKDQESDKPIPGAPAARETLQTVPSPTESPDVISQSIAQRVAAQRMQESKQTIPHFYLHSSANAESAANRRNTALGEKPSWDACFVYAVGKALKKYPRMCVSYIDGQLRSQPVDAVGLAVDFDGDLFVCPIVNPGVKTPEIISAEIVSWIQRLKEGDQQVRKVQPANLTVTNLGAVGIESFTAVINPPEAAILAVGKVSPTVVALDRQVVIQNRVKLTLSVDHRVVNGRYAGEFLTEIIREFESL